MMEKYNISNIIKELANGNDNAHMICLYLYMNDCVEILNDLYELDIKGDDLEIFVYDYCLDTDLVYIKQAVDFLKSGFLDKKEIEKNLKRNAPVPFLPSLLDEELDTEYQYKIFAEELKKSLNIKKR